MSATTDRRGFIKGLSGMAAAGMGGCLPLDRFGPSSGGRRPRVALFGAEGRGYEDLLALVADGRAEVAAICDPDYSSRDRVQRALIRDGVDFDMYAVPFRTDYRRLLDDAPMLGLAAAVVSLPDHVHAPVAALALRAGLHVCVQPPLARTLGELDALSKVAAETGLVVSPDMEFGRDFALGEAVLRAGLLGEVSEIRVWTGFGGDAPGSAGAAAAPDEEVPDGLNWNAWLASAAPRPFRRAYLDGWRGLRDFGCGAFGDAAARAFALPFLGLELGRASAAELIDAQGGTDAAHPSSSVVALTFPERASAARHGETLPPARVVFTTGSGVPSDPAAAPFRALPEAGCLVVGEKGTMCASPDAERCLVAMAGEAEAADVSRHAAFRDLAQEAEAAGRPCRAGVACFLDAVAGRGRPPCGFDDFASLSESLLVALAAQSVCARGETLLWDSVRRRFDRADANILSRPSARDGFSM